MNHRIYDDILQNIFDKDIKNFTIKCLEKVDPILEKIPASASGKYHPAECCQPGGLVIHVKRACYFANIMIKAFNWSENEIRADILLSALLLHDIGKKEHYEKGSNDYINHPINAAAMIKEFDSLIHEKIFTSIANCVKYHMGPWTPPWIRKPMEKYTQLELLTYQCDYLAARKDVEVIRP